MQTSTPRTANAPAAAARRPWANWFARKPPSAVTALMLGERCLLVRMQSSGHSSGRLQLQAVAEGDASALRLWQAQQHFARCQPLLVLPQQQRQLLTLDRPEVADAELAMALRFPMAEAMELEPDQLLCTALALPRINDSAKAQVLAVAAQIDSTREQLQQLSAAGIQVRNIDTIDSALRGMTLLQGVGNNGVIALAFIGNDICIGLLWRGEFCALRTLALPVRAPRDNGEFEDQLALHIQRTTDHFERQATQLAVRDVLASMPALAPAARESLRAALPLTARLFELSELVDMDAATRQKIEGHNDLTALACVAAARLLDIQAQRSAVPAEASAAADAAEVLS